MNYNYTAYYKTDEERINAIAEDILKEYPNLGELATEAAKMETPFGRAHEDYEGFSDQENHINRLIDIIIVTEGKKEFQAEYEKAYQDLLKNYESWKRNFTYANPEEQPAYLIIEMFKKHQNDQNVQLMTYGQASAEQRRRAKEKELKRKSDALRSEFPGLGQVADEVIKLEEESGFWIRFQENDIIRLVTIIKLIEGNNEYTEVYKKVLQVLEEKYTNWLKYETNYMSEEKKLIIEMMDKLKAHIEDNSVPISLYYELSQEQKKK